MATLSNMYLRLNSLDPRVKAELFRDGGHHRIIVFIDGMRKGYLTRSSCPGRFEFWQDGWNWAPEYTPIQVELLIITYLRNNTLY